MLRGAGRSFCAGYDFGGGFHHWDEMLTTDGEWDPGKDFVGAGAYGPTQKFMSIWRTPKPVIAQVHGWCVGGGSDMALCADLIIASEDAQIGTPYSRIWGCYLSGMWLYRLGLTRAKEHALTGRPLSGREAAEVELITRAVPFERLEEEVATQAQQLASLPSSQLAAMKLIVNQAYENMGLNCDADAGPDPRRADAEHPGRPRVHRAGPTRRAFGRRRTSATRCSATTAWPARTAGRTRRT